MIQLAMNLSKNLMKKIKKIILIIFNISCERAKTFDRFDPGFNSLKKNIFYIVSYPKRCSWTRCTIVQQLIKC